MPLKASDVGPEFISRAAEDNASPSGVRKWQDGDELKKVHWKLTLKKREVMVRTYYPVDADALPCIVYIHGGGFVLGNPDTHDRITRVLAGGSWWGVIGAFFVMGLLLAFTPCVLPMLPILSSIIAGSGAVTRKRGTPGQCGDGIALAGAAGLGTLDQGCTAAAADRDRCLFGAADRLRRGCIVARAGATCAG